MARFFFISLVVVCGLHYLLYVTAVRFAVVGKPTVRRTLLWLLMLLGVSFLPSAVLMRLLPGTLSGLFYFAAAFWMGLFIYLLMAAGVSWAVLGVGKLAGLAPNMRAVFIGMCILAAVVAVYGTCRAMYPSIKQLDITLEGLPEVWRGKRIVHLSDVHLGAVRGPRFLERIITRVNSVQPDLILITGDLFDGVSSGSLADFIEPLNRLEARQGVFFVTGNHEGYLGLSGPLAILGWTGIRILDNEIVDIDGLQFIGLSFPEHNRENNIHDLFQTPAYHPEKPGILLYHTPTNIQAHFSDRAGQQTGTYWQPDTRTTFAKTMGIDLQLSGHTHGGQFFPFTLITRLIYGGYDRGLHREEDFQIYITSGAGTWGPPMRVACPPEIPVITLH